MSVDGGAPCSGAAKRRLEEEAGEVAAVTPQVRSLPRSLGEVIEGCGSGLDDFQIMRVVSLWWFTRWAAIIAPSSSHSWMCNMEDL